jgi:hypothetical protein
VGLLLWSSVALACDGSLLADVVRCSFELYRRWAAGRGGRVGKAFKEALMLLLHRR